MVQSGLLDRLRLGDHICWLVDDDRVRVQTVAAFVRSGLQADHKIVFCVDDPGAMLAGIDERGIDTAPVLATGQLVAVAPEDAHLAGGGFDAPEVLQEWGRQSVAARAAGYRGLRVLGDMTWATRGVPGSEHLTWYEAQANRLFLEHDLIGVCAYDRRVFDPMDLRRITCSHAGAAGTGLPFDETLSLRFRRTRDPLGVRLEGEADMSNRHALQTVFEYLFVDAGADEVTVDVHGLRFADRGAARILVRAGAGPQRLRLVGCSPALVRLLNFAGAAEASGLTVEPAA